MGHETIGGAVDQRTLPSDADGSQDVVSGAHDLPDARLVKFLDGASRCRLQLILKDDETNEIKSTLGLLSLHLLDICPSGIDCLGRTSYDTEPAVCVEVQEVIIVKRD